MALALYHRPGEARIADASAERQQPQANRQSMPKPFLIIVLLKFPHRKLNHAVIASNTGASFFYESKRG
jgi:hypothetical protein